METALLFILMLLCNFVSTEDLSASLAPGGNFNVSWSFGETTPDSEIVFTVSFTSFYCTHTHIHTHTHTLTHTHTYTHSHTRANTHKHTSKHMRKHTRKRMRKHIRKHTRAHTRTHTHTFLLSCCHLKFSGLLDYVTIAYALFRYLLAQKVGWVLDSPLMVQ